MYNSNKITPIQTTGLNSARGQQISTQRSLLSRRDDPDLQKETLNLNLLVPSDRIKHKKDSKKSLIRRVMSN